VGRGLGVGLIFGVGLILGVAVGVVLGVAVGVAVGVTVAVPLGVGVGVPPDCAQYLQPVFKTVVGAWTPPQMTISLPVQIPLSPM
jgi:hypothetical protein